MKNQRFKTKCVDVMVNVKDHEHVLVMKEDDSNTGMFGSKIVTQQFEKVESVLSKRYIKLPFGVRLLL